MIVTKRTVHQTSMSRYVNERIKVYIYIYIYVTFRNVYVLYKSIEDLSWTLRLKSSSVECHSDVIFAEKF